MMRYIISLFFLVFLFSCELNINKKKSVDEILDEEWRTFNWSDVDEYPSFSRCDSLQNLSLKKQCFITTLSDQISEDLIINTKTVNRTIQDTVMLRFVISKNGEITLEELIVDKNIIDLKGTINSSFESSIDKLPKIFPAIKRGQQVNVKFSLPIFVSTE
ncbi:MAG: hypothetical protein EVA44_03345 [Flavobacteriales bacterium]|nr:hypothetical protein [Flavobacteriaceae bacterium]RZP06318.1 MAG: hypothetical protein EVA44_03345 [Flavobacteriales bacterium]|tara:strand:- start:203 stop:682 length:480 start_codon:yes stop_codon:yes gene_type:complete